MMLEQLVAKVRQGGTLETGRLAAELGAPIELVEAMLEHLQRQGLIQDFVRCTDGCQACSLRGACVGEAGSQLRLWSSSGPSE
ncbi:MAG: FeoC-like transcriptional regulator [Chloroflexota bacterium]